MRNSTAIIMGNFLAYSSKDFASAETDDHFARLFRALDVNRNQDLDLSEIKSFLSGKHLKEGFPKMKGGQEIFGFGTVNTSFAYAVNQHQMLKSCCACNVCVSQ